MQLSHHSPTGFSPPNCSINLSYNATSHFLLIVNNEFGPTINTGGETGSQDQDSATMLYLTRPPQLHKYQSRTSPTSSKGRFTASPGSRMYLVLLHQSNITYAAHLSNLSSFPGFTQVCSCHIQSCGGLANLGNSNYMYSSPQNCFNVWNF